MPLRTASAPRNAESMQQPYHITALPTSTARATRPLGRWPLPVGVRATGRRALLDFVSSMSPACTTLALVLAWCRPCVVRARSCGIVITMGIKTSLKLLQLEWSEHGWPPARHQLHRSAAAAAAGWGRHSLPLFLPYVGPCADRGYSPDARLMMGRARQACGPSRGTPGGATLAHGPGDRATTPRHSYPLPTRLTPNSFADLNWSNHYNNANALIAIKKKKTKQKRQHLFKLTD